MPEIVTVAAIAGVLAAGRAVELVAQWWRR